ncbi:MAG: MoaD/ThiS family protein [Nitrospinae bacterium]|nr:MoaD/ThiS family protein [Nitrospinota bacterium]
MKVAVRLYAQLMDYLPHDTMGHPFELTLEEGTTIGDLLARLGIPQEAASSSILLVNGEHGRPSQGLKEGDGISILPPICGGKL